MSGVKHSTVELERELRARQQALLSINKLTAAIAGLEKKAKALWAEVPSGVKASFSQEAQQVDSWLSRLRALPQASDQMSSLELELVVTELQRLEEQGKQALQLIVEIKETKREERARELITRQQSLKAELAGAEPLLRKWEPSGYSQADRVLEGLTGVIEQGEFVAATDLLNQTAEALSNLKQRASLLEEQDMQRRYVLEALRRVCTREMGWLEVGEPRLEDAQDPASALLYEVDALSAGRMIFRLTLEGIQVDSPIARDRCYKDFAVLSAELAKFGVITEFKRVEAPDEDPRLIRRGELDLPDEGIEMEMER